MLNTLHKSERLDKKKVIDKMFSGGARSFSVFPLRVVYLPVEELEAPVSILVSVNEDCTGTYHGEGIGRCCCAESRRKCCVC